MIYILFRSKFIHFSYHHRESSFPPQPKTKNPSATSNRSRYLLPRCHRKSIFIFYIFRRRIFHENCLLSLPLHTGLIGKKEYIKPHRIPLCWCELELRMSHQRKMRVFSYFLLAPLASHSTNRRENYADFLMIPLWWCYAFLYAIFPLNKLFFYVPSRGPHRHLVLYRMEWCVITIKAAKIVLRNENIFYWGIKGWRRKSVSSEGNRLVNLMVRRSRMEHHRHDFSFRAECVYEKCSTTRREEGGDGKTNKKGISCIHGW